MSNVLNLSTGERQPVVDRSSVTGIMTVSNSVAVAIKAGASELVGRGILTIVNCSNIPVRLGGADITEDKGYLIYPNEKKIIYFDRSIATSYYGRSTGFNAILEVMEE